MTDFPKPGSEPLLHFAGRSVRVVHMSATVKHDQKGPLTPLLQAEVSLTSHGPRFGWINWP